MRTQGRKETDPRSEQSLALPPAGQQWDRKVRGALTPTQEHCSTLCSQKLPEVTAQGFPNPEPERRETEEQRKGKHAKRGWERDDGERIDGSSTEIYNSMNTLLFPVLEIASGSITHGTSKPESQEFSVRWKATCLTTRVSEKLLEVSKEIPHTSKERFLPKDYPIKLC